MPFCPTCGKEFQEKIKKCPDCNKRLVEALSDEHFEGEMIEVFGSFSVAEAGLVKELLIDDGMFAALSNEMFGSLYAGVPSLAGEVKVFVSNKDVERSRELIETYIEDNPLEDRDEYFVCDHCGAEVDENERYCPFCGEPFEN